MSIELLKAINIHKSFGGVRALKNVNFDLTNGQIHCLVGENGSGKTTFVKLIAGVYPPDKGEIILNGKKYTRLTVRDSIREGVQVIYQDLSLFPHMSVAENIAINKLIVQKKNLINWRGIQNIAQEQLDKIGESINLKKPVSNISTAEKQLVAICRALSMDAKILFMDEPTTALKKHDIDRLISIVLDLKKKGMSIVFISHKLGEVMEVADKIAIFRDGEKVGDFPSCEVNEELLTYYMTGREVKYSRYIRKNKEEEPIIEVKNLTRKGHYSDISFKVCRGDIIGLIGPMGAGRTELAMTLFGLNPQNSGKIILEGKECRIKSPEQASEWGISLVPDNRQTKGCYMGKSITDNVCSTVLKEFSKVLGFLDNKLMNSKTQYIVNELSVVTENVSTEVQNLSGGNQQKVVIGRWIVKFPKVLIVDSPTVGVDVGAKAEIYEHIKYFATKDVGIIYITDEIQEVIRNCNKILVMRTGKCVAYFDDVDLQAHDSDKRIYQLMYDGTVGSN